MAEEADDLFDGGNGFLAGRARRAIFTDVSGESIEDLDNVLAPDSLVQPVGLCVARDSLLSPRKFPVGLALPLFSRKACDCIGRSL